MPANPKELEELAAVSRKYGADPRFVLLGGGNTSWKSPETLYIKPSGVALAAIRAGDFLAMDRAAVRGLFSAEMPDSPWEREAAVKQHMLGAVRPLGSGRPSVETPLHESIPYAFVVHLHPALVNAMTCARDGAAACARLFPEALWIEYTDPGYTLAMTVAGRLRELAAQGAESPHVIFLQNHGVFVAADTLVEIEETYARIMTRLEGALEAAGIRRELRETGRDDSLVQQIAPALRTWLGRTERRAVVCSAPYFAPPAGPLTPDHIVYAKSYPLLVDARVDAAEVRRFQDAKGYLPRVVAVRDQAVFTAGPDLKTARGVLAVARDGARIQQWSHAFGGPRFLDDRSRKFIENWEVESYRSKVARGARRPGAVEGKIAVVTGGAQGFGLGIARGLLREGAVVFLADINLEGARAAARALAEEFGPDRAIPVPVNVSDEESVQHLTAEVVRTCGGLDLFVVNAGVLRAAPLRELSRKDWDLVTAVNYTGYFLCAKHAAIVMARQSEAGPGPWMDIIQINSKSGLEGSNKNAAYAGSKFGGIGLTQSFAKELVESRIKVNSICPGNFFDGPLWSDPDNGLFVQYLRAGKVPGAASVDDVRRFYEAKVPMGRGCTPEDVLKAIFYIIAQEYETGQAVPVTGGQIMLR